MENNFSDDFASKLKSRRKSKITNEKNLLRRLTPDRKTKGVRQSFMENIKNTEGKKLLILLKIKCPGCMNQLKDKAKSHYWIHNPCSTKVYIDETGDLSCENKSCKKFFIKSAKFYCGEDHGVEYSQYTDLSDLLQALAHGVESIRQGLTDKFEIHEWITRLSINISIRWEEEKLL